MNYKKSYGALFKPITVNTCYFNEVKKKFRSEYKNNPKSFIIIWGDFDLYKRNDKDCWEIYKKGELTQPIDKSRFEMMLNNLESGKFYSNDFGKFLLDNIKHGYFEFNDR